MYLPFLQRRKPYFDFAPPNFYDLHRALVDAMPAGVWGFIARLADAHGLAHVIPILPFRIFKSLIHNPYPITINHYHKLLNS